MIGISVEDVYVKHQGFIIKSIREFGCRPADLEDIVHEVFVKLIRTKYLDKYDHNPARGSLCNYIRKVIRSVTIDFYRRKREILTDNFLSEAAKLIGVNDDPELNTYLNECYNDLLEIGVWDGYFEFDNKHWRLSPSSFFMLLRCGLNMSDIMRITGIDQKTYYGMKGKILDLVRYRSYA